MAAKLAAIGMVTLALLGGGWAINQTRLHDSGLELGLGFVMWRCSSIVLTAGAMAGIEPDRVKMTYVKIERRLRDLIAVVVGLVWLTLFVWLGGGAQLLGARTIGAALDWTMLIWASGHIALQSVEYDFNRSKVRGPREWPAGWFDAILSGLLTGITTGMGFALLLLSFGSARSSRDEEPTTLQLAVLLVVYVLLGSLLRAAAVARRGILEPQVSHKRLLDVAWRFCKFGSAAAGIGMFVGCCVGAIKAALDNVPISDLATVVDVYATFGGTAGAAVGLLWLPREGALRTRSLPKQWYFRLRP